MISTLCYWFHRSRTTARTNDEEKNEETNPRKSFVYLIIFQFVEIKKREENQQPHTANQNRWIDEVNEAARKNFVFMLHHWDDETWALLLKREEYEESENRQKAEKRLQWTSQNRFALCAAAGDMEVEDWMKIRKNPSSRRSDVKQKKTVKNSVQGFMHHSIWH